MDQSSSPQKTREIFPELFSAIQVLEGRYPANEVAARVVRAAMLLSGVVGARLWRVERGAAAVWAEGGELPASFHTNALGGAMVNPGKDATLWTGALGSDDFRVRILEVHGNTPFKDEVRAQLEFLGRFAATVLALAERRGSMEELSSIVEATKRLN